MEQKKAQINRSTNGRPQWRRLLLVSLPAGLSFLGGASYLVVDFLDPPSQPCRAAGALLLVASAAVQAMVLRRIWRKPVLLELRDFSQRRYFYRWLIAGWLVCYAVAVAIGVRPGIEAMFAGLATVWYAAWLWTRTCGDVLPAAVAKVWRSPTLGLVGRSLATVLFGVAAAELAMRLYSCADEHFTSKLVVDAIKAQSVYAPERDLSRYREATRDPTSVVQPAVTESGFHIAILGDEVALSRGGQTCCLGELERRLSNVHIANFGLPMAGPREYQAVFRDEVAPCEPDLVLCFLSVDSDVTEQIPLPGAFDWRGLKLCQLVDRALGMELATGMLADENVAANRRLYHSRCDYLRDRARQLNVCRAPMGDEMRSRWDEIFVRLGALSDACRTNHVDFGIVVVPGDFQVNPALCQTLQRRLGYSSKDIDIQLPQRRLALFAQQQQLELLDLLPHLVGAGPAAFGHNDHRLSDRGGAVAAAAVGSWIESGFSDQIAAAGHKRTIYAADLSRTALRR